MGYAIHQYTPDGYYQVYFVVEAEVLDMLGDLETEFPESTFEVTPDEL